MKKLIEIKKRTIELREASTRARDWWREASRAHELSKRNERSAERKKGIGVTVVVVLVGMMVGGCISNTVRGFGTLVQGIGTDTIQAVDGYDSERSK